jgi:hypothetical protein
MRRVALQLVVLKVRINGIIPAVFLNANEKAISFLFELASDWLNGKLHLLHFVKFLFEIVKTGNQSIVQ